MSRPPAERFAKKHHVTDTGCWEWTSWCNDKGYGQFWFGGKYVMAHRWSYTHHVGPIPDGLFVCHHCDNPPCVNPEHLFVGTLQDNMDDCVAKGRLSQRPRPKPKPADQIRHGMTHTYSVRGCRCDLCVAEAPKLIRGYNAKYRASLTPEELERKRKQVSLYVKVRDGLLGRDEYEEWLRANPPMRQKQAG